MALANHSTPALADDVRQCALDDFVSVILENKGRERKSRKELLAFAVQMETFNGRHVPGPNIVPLRGPSRTEREIAEEAQRRRQALHAWYVRQLVERYL